jgi:hypothetical protein
MSTTQQFLTAAYIGVHLRRPYAVVLSAIAELKIVPTLTLNELVYFSAADEVRIYEHIEKEER